MFNASATPTTTASGATRPPHGTFSYAIVRVEPDALRDASQHKVRVVLELTPNKWLLNKTWDFSTDDKKRWMLHDVGCILEAAGETVVGNPAFNFQTLQEMLRAINGRRCALQTSIWKNAAGEEKTGVQHFLSPNADRGRADKWNEFLAQVGAAPAAAPAASPATTSAAPRRPAI